MYPHPYDMVPARPLDPPCEPWSCRKCGQVCDAWHCQICREIQCGYDDDKPVEVITLTEGRKMVCQDCAEVNLDDCRVRDLQQARTILKELQSSASYFEGIEDLSEHETPYALLGHALEYVDRRTAKERGIGYSEFVMEMLKDSLAALKKPVEAEAHNYAEIYKERFGGVAHA